MSDNTDALFAYLDARGTFRCAGCGWRSRELAAYLPSGEPLCPRCLHLVPKDEPCACPACVAPCRCAIVTQYGRVELLSDERGTVWGSGQRWFCETHRIAIEE